MRTLLLVLGLTLAAGAFGITVRMIGYRAVDRQVQAGDTAAAIGGHVTVEHQAPLGFRTPHTAFHLLHALDLPAQDR